MGALPDRRQQPSRFGQLGTRHIALAVAFAFIVAVMVALPFDPRVAGVGLFALPILGAFYGRPRHGLQGGLLGGAVAGALIGAVSCLSNGEMDNLWLYTLVSTALGIPLGFAVGMVIHVLPGQVARSRKRTQS